MTEFVVNGEAVETDASPDTPLLWVLREHLGLTGTKFGCGAAMCGACTVHVGYCQSGQIMRAAALLAENPSPSRDDIRETMSANLCRCGTYTRIFRAVERAAREA